MMRTMMPVIFPAILLIFSVPASAYTDLGGRYTSGSDGYSGVNAFAEWGDDNYYFRPGFNTYKSDLSDRLSTYSLGAGLERENWSAGAELFRTPETDYYENAGLYADFIYYFLHAPAEDAALEDMSLGVFSGLTMHDDTYAASTVTITLTEALKLNQTDYGLTAAIKLWSVRASGRFTKTAYNKDITAEARKVPLYLGSIGSSGFPDTAVSARLRVPGWPVAPEAGYIRTTYLLDQPASESFTLGLSVKAGKAQISAGWENFRPGGGADRRDFYSLDLTMSF